MGQTLISFYRVWDIDGFTNIDYIVQKLFLKALSVTCFTITYSHYGLYNLNYSFFMTLLTLKCKEWLCDSS